MSGEFVEAIFGVTQNPIGSPKVARRGTPDVELVSCGTALPTIAIEVRDAAGQLLADGEVGQIHVAGPHVFKGYRQNDAAVIDGRGFFATGDLGFLLDGELYVTGRLKDLIIVNGENLYPHDIEELVLRQAGVRAE